MPWEGNASVTYHGPSGMTLYLRVPSYAENFSVKRNGEPLKPEKEKGYVRLTPQMEPAQREKILRQWHSPLPKQVQIFYTLATILACSTRL